MARRRKSGGSRSGAGKAVKRDYYGRFTAGPAGGGKGTKKLKPAFKSGGTPRYYAPGGKTYATSPIPAGGSMPRARRQSATTRRYVGYQKAQEAKAKNARKRRNKKIAIGVATTAVVVGGGVLAYKHRETVVGTARSTKYKVGETLALQAERRIGRAKNLVNPMTGKTVGQHMAARYPAVNPAPTTSSDNGFQGATATVGAIGAGGVAVSLTKNAADTTRNINNLTRQVKAINQDGVSEEDRHVPESIMNSPSLEDEAWLRENIRNSMMQEERRAMKSPPAAAPTDDEWAMFDEHNSSPQSKYSRVSDAVPHPVERLVTPAKSTTANIGKTTTPNQMSIDFTDKQMHAAKIVNPTDAAKNGVDNMGNPIRNIRTKPNYERPRGEAFESNRSTKVSGKDMTGEGWSERDGYLINKDPGVEYMGINEKKDVYIRNKKSGPTVEPRSEKIQKFKNLDDDPNAFGTNTLAAAAFEQLGGDVDPVDIMKQVGIDAGTGESKRMAPMEKFETSRGITAAGNVKRRPASKRALYGAVRQGINAGTDQRPNSAGIVSSQKLNESLAKNRGYTETVDSRQFSPTSMTPGTYVASRRQARDMDIGILESRPNSREGIKATLRDSEISMGTPTGKKKGPWSNKGQHGKTITRNSRSGRTEAVVSIPELPNAVDTGILTNKQGKSLHNYLARQEAQAQHGGGTEGTNVTHVEAVNIGSTMHRDLRSAPLALPDSSAYDPAVERFVSAYDEGKLPKSAAGERIMRQYLAGKPVAYSALPPHIQRELTGNLGGQASARAKATAAADARRKKRASRNKGIVD